MRIFSRGSGPFSLYQAEAVSVTAKITVTGYMQVLLAGGINTDIGSANFSLIYGFEQLFNIHLGTVIQDYFYYFPVIIPHNLFDMLHTYFPFLGFSLS
jgi:hypothetical protein